jgi:hypothetical protein
MIASAGILASLIVGAGMFSLPSIFVRSGLIYGLLALGFFTWVSASLSSRYAEVIDEGGSDKRFAGYAKKHFGKKGYLLGLLFTLGGIAISLSIYLSLAPSFFSLIFPFMPETVSVFLFWTFGTMIAFLGTKRGSSTSLLVFSLMMVAIALFAVFALFKGDASNITSASLFEPRNLFLPFGPLLFSLSGRSALSAIRERYGEKEYSLTRFKKAIKLGAVIPALIYIVFILMVIALSGGGVTSDAVTGLTFLPTWALVAMGILGILTIIDSYALIGLEFAGVLSRDAKMPKQLAYGLFAIIPLVIYFLISGDFLTLVGVGGGIFLAAESIMVVLMRRKISGARLSDLVLAVVFLIGIIYQIGIFR